MKKKKAKKGNILYCKELKRYATATLDEEHKWEEIKDVRKEDCK